MGKIVKYCAVCEESFAEKFMFCPNCAAPMTAFEMSPLAPNAPVVEETKPESVEEFKSATAMSEPVFRTSEPTSGRIKTPVEDEPLLEIPAVEQKPFIENQFNNQTQSLSEESLVEDAPTEDLPVEETPSVTKTFAAAAAETNGNGSYRQSEKQTFQPAASSMRPSEDGFSVTFVEEKNGKQRNLLFLGSMVLILTVAISGTIYSLFTKDFGIGAIEDGSLFAAVVVDEVPTEIEEEPKKAKDDGGGGGGGGREEQEEASKGRLVSQSEKPIFPPNAKVPQLTNPEIKYVQETQGTIKRPVTEERAGLPGSDNLNPSNGTGRGGGLGSGTGSGLGSGTGTGEGSGTGSGSGSGEGNSIGGGIGSGGSRTPPPPPPSRPVEVVTTPFRIISKPRPGYTDAARQNQVTGVVRLKVTFLASGAIGSIAPVSGLPYGLTEQAIAAARQIKFEPQKKNGAAVAVTKTIEYSFSIY